MDSLLLVSFEARCPERNHQREYTIRIGQDLLGDWLVCVGYGRIGHAGQELRFGGADPNRLQPLVHRCLRRRLTAPRRLGCAYRLTQLSIEEGFDRAAWLPDELLTGFMVPIRM